MVFILICITASLSRGHEIFNCYVLLLVEEILHFRQALGGDYELVE